MRTLLLMMFSGTLAAAQQTAPAALPLDAVPTVTLNRTKVPLGSPIEITYTWRVEKRTDTPPQDYRALLRFSDARGDMLFNDDHVPVPPTSQWKPGQTYRYTRTVFVPVYPYLGATHMSVGLHPRPGGARDHAVGEFELLSQYENLFLVYKEGWHAPEPDPEHPQWELAWTKKEAIVSFKNPRKDVVVYLKADSRPGAFAAPPVLTLAINARGLTVPIKGSAPFLEKVRFKAADLGTADWVDLRLKMNRTFVDKDGDESRELGLRVHNVFVGVEEALGAVPDLVDAARLR